MRSVSFIFKLCNPVNRKGMFIKQQVTTKVCAKSGISTKSSFKQVTGVPILVSITPWSVYVVCTPSLANISAPRLSP